MGWRRRTQPSSAPATLYTLERLEEEVKEFQLVTSGKFNDAVTCFMDILLQVPFWWWKLAKKSMTSRELHYDRS